jgi:hypothetical protein
MRRLAAIGVVLSLAVAGLYSQAFPPADAVTRQAWDSAVRRQTILVGPSQVQALFASSAPFTATFKNCPASEVLRVLAAHAHAQVRLTSPEAGTTLVNVYVQAAQVSDLFEFVLDAADLRVVAIEGRTLIVGR